MEVCRERERERERERGMIVISGNSPMLRHGDSTSVTGAEDVITYLKEQVRDDELMALYSKAILVNVLFHVPGI